MIGKERASRILPHLLVGGLALSYAWVVSGSAYVATGIQFVFPFVVIFLGHITWLVVTKNLKPGFCHLALAKSALTSVFGVATIFCLTLVAPMPSHSTSLKIGSQLNNLMGFLFCLAVLAGIVAAIASIFYYVFKWIRAAYRILRRKNGNDDGDILHDFGGVLLILMLLTAMSLEGVPFAYKFATEGHSSSSYYVSAKPAQVWKSVSKATSPEFPLPSFLQVFPQPVEVLVDEGSNVGARRIVKFKGREGEGCVILKVVERSETKVVFKAVSDTSPIANWMKHDKLVYSVLPEGEGTRLTVRLEYDRKLAPAWAFGPMVKLATHFAMDVLARDTMERAELGRIN